MKKGLSLKVLFVFVAAFVLVANTDLAFSQDGCPLSKGYWKNHPEDTAWDVINGFEPLYEGGPSLYEGMFFKPKGGNAFVILAQQYVAMALNVNSGACAPWEDTEFFSAVFGSEELLNTYLYELNIPKDSPDRQLALQYAKILDDYNNGYLCPGVCKCPCWTSDDLASLTGLSCVQSTSKDYVSVNTIEEYALATSARPGETPDCQVADYSGEYPISFARGINYTQFLDCRNGLEMLIDEAGLMCSEP